GHWSTKEPPGHSGGVVRGMVQTPRVYGPNWSRKETCRLGFLDLSKLEKHGRPVNSTGLPRSIQGERWRRAQARQCNYRKRKGLTLGFSCGTNPLEPLFRLHWQECPCASACARVEPPTGWGDEEAPQRGGRGASWFLWGNGDGGGTITKAA